VPVLVGGTGFYLRTLRKPLFESPKTDEVLRERFRAIHTKHGPAHLHNMLQRLDPAAAQNLFPNDYVRVIRALEVFFQTGKPISEQQPNRIDPPEFAARIRVFALNPPREILYEKIDRRTGQHFAEGLVEEVKELRASGISDDTNALGSHAYRRVCEYLRGERDLESAIEQSARDVRHYAKRQITWFKREEGVIWFDGFGDEPEIFDKLVSKLNKL
jgi:tRNA dimethylallyltransferase